MPWDQCCIQQALSQLGWQTVCPKSPSPGNNMPSGSHALTGQWLTLISGKSNPVVKQTRQESSVLFEAQTEVFTTHFRNNWNPKILFEVSAFNTIKVEKAFRLNNGKLWLIIWMWKFLFYIKCWIQIKKLMTTKGFMMKIYVIMSFILIFRSVKSPLFPQLMELCFIRHYQNHHISAGAFHNEPKPTWSHLLPSWGHYESPM